MMSRASGQCGEMSWPRLRVSSLAHNHDNSMLEIGALAPANFAARQSYIDNTPIDLNSRHPDILKQDFMERPLPQSAADQFDLISCSLVLNFVPLPEVRGRCLRPRSFLYC